MRKIITILLGLTLCLLFSWSGHAAQSTPTSQPVQSLILDHNSTQQWSCESKYNSDMGQPRLTVESSPTVVVNPSSRSWQGAQRLDIHNRSIHARTTASIQSFLDHNSTTIIQPPVDYYVYRLRRLII